MNVKTWIIIGLIVFAAYIYVSYLVVGVLLTMIYSEATKIQIMAATFLVTCVIGALNNRSK